MTPFRIVPKRDFCSSGPGFWLPNAGTTGTGRYGFVKRGFVVTDGCCNVMPAAIWFRTVSDAMLAIRIYCEAHGDARKFWDAYRAIT
jgi:hypothetical protein